jgi:hypothetical protein
MCAPPVESRDRRRNNNPQTLPLDNAYFFDSVFLTNIRGFQIYRFPLESYAGSRSVLIPLPSLGQIMQRFLVVAGLVILVIGLAWPWLGKLPFGRLPGDISIVREGYSVYFPIVTCLIISVVVSVLLWLFRR